MFIRVYLWFIQHDPWLLGASLLITQCLSDHQTNLNYNISMHQWRLFLIVILSISLSACGPTTAAPAELTSSPAQILPTPPPPEELPTPAPTQTPTPDAPLDGQTTFAVIAAVQGSIATIQLWVQQGLSVFERQAVVRPLAETSVAPLGDILQNFTPAPALAESWTQAADLQAQFYPLLQSWIEGEIDDTAFGQSLDNLTAQTGQMITTAEEIAQTQLGVDTTLYGPDYTLANDIVFVLSPLIGGNTNPQDSAPQETSDLVVQQLIPFTYSFAGTDIFTVIGLLENTGSTAQSDVEIEVHFYDDEDTLLGVTTGVLAASTALPGRAYPFNASTITQGEEKHLFNWTRYETRILARESDSVTYQDFTLTAASTETTSLGEITLAGTLTNSGSQTVPVGVVHIGVAAYAADGSLIGVGTGTAALLAELTPGGSADFQASIAALNGEPASYQFFAEASD